MLVPKLRFKREDGTDYPEWSNKSFANAFAPLNNNTFSRDMLSENGTVLNIHYGDILVKFGEVCDIKTADIPKVNADIETSKYDELQDGDIILADTAEDETVGKAIEIYRVGASKVISGLHTMACRPNDKYAAKYMGYYINSPTYHNQLFPLMQGIKVTSIGRKNIADTVIYYPSDLEEQQKIADFLSAVDEVIAQSQAEVQNLEQQKKAAMQKIFSQEVRFKREDGTEYPEWEEKTLKEVTSHFQSGKAINRSDISETGNYAVYGGNGLRGYTDSYNHFGDYVLIGRQGALCGNVCYVTGKNYFTEHAIAVQANKENCLKFLLFQFDFMNLGQYSGQSAQAGLAVSRITQITAYFPCLEEQQKIADFLSAYDEAISCAKQELEHWKQLKKGLLQQMFV